MTRGRARREGGFTLIEIGVVIFVMVLLVSIALPTLRTLTGIQARTEVSKLASNIRAARGHAAVAGETCRMVFNIKGNSYSLECSKGLVQVEKETSRGGKAETEKSDHGMDISEEQAKARAALKAKQKFTTAKVLPLQTLAGKLEFVSVWTPHQEEAYTEGNAALYFFPSGSSETANIVLRFGDEFYTVQVASLAGNVRILGEKATLPDQDDGE